MASWKGPRPRTVALAVPSKAVELALVRACLMRGIPVSSSGALSELLHRIDAWRAVVVVVFDGFSGLTLVELCSHVRNAHRTFPLLLALSDHAGIPLEKAVLEAGADDFVGSATKEIDRVHLRFDALIHAASRRQLQRLMLGRIDADLVTQQVRVAGKALRLTPVEFRMLVYLMHHAGRTVSHEELQHIAVGSHGTSLYEHMRRLLAKLGSARGAIRNVRGSGYVLSP